MPDAGARHLAMGRGGTEGEQEESWLNGRTERERIKSCPHPSRQHSSLTHASATLIPAGKRGGVRSRAPGAPWGRRCCVSRPAWCKGRFFNHFARDSIFQLRGVSRAFVSRRKKKKNNQTSVPPKVVFAPRASGGFAVHVSSCPVLRSRRK